MGILPFIREKLYTCATQFLEENVDEQLIQLQTGPRSGVRAYKCPTKSHALKISNILQPHLPNYCIT